MRIYRIAIPIIAVLIAIAGCNSRKESTTIDRFTEVYSPEYASGFRILSDTAGESVIIESINPWQGVDSETRRLLIVRGGESIPAGFDGKIVKGDIRRIVTMSSTQIAMLDLLGEGDKIYGVSGIDFICSPGIASRRDSITDVGYEGNVDYERIMGLNPDLVLLYGVNGPSSMEGKLDELGIPYIYIGDYMEQSPLGKAEWLVALAEIAGNRQQGEEKFADIPRRYNALKEAVAENALDAPSVMLNIPYGDSWFLPSDNNYMIHLIKDAGGDYIYKKNSGNSSRPVDQEEAYLLTSQADMWLNTGTANTLAEVGSACPKFTGTRCFSNGCLYNNNHRQTPGGGNDFYESGIVNPDLILKDLIQIFHPGLLPADTLTYYHRLK